MLQAVDDLNNKEVDGREIYVGRAQKKAERQAELKEKFERMKMERINRYQGVNLYVKNLDEQIDDERLRKEFSQFGTITSARVCTHYSVKALIVATLLMYSLDLPLPTKAVSERVF